MEKVLKITSLKDRNTDYSYWITKSPQERLSAVELLRQNYYSLNKNVQQRFQRVLRVIDKKQG